ncbi:MAG: pilA [Methylococcaceae bacterium NSP1-2]|nr:MAG: pilA [Methylococcaceae bacterium NSP1-2]
MKTLKSQHGFTLIELMIVIAIIGTLASIAIPTYQDYIIKTKVIEGLSLVASAKSAVSENAISGVTFDSGWVQPFPTNIVSTDPLGVSRLAADSGVSINNDNGEITITYTNKIAKNSPTLLLVPVDGASPLVPGQLIQGGMINWQCHSSKPPLNNVLRYRAGTIDPQFVPSDCRA